MDTFILEGPIRNVMVRTTDHLLEENNKDLRDTGNEPDIYGGIPAWLNNELN